MFCPLRQVVAPGAQSSVSECNLLLRKFWFPLKRFEWNKQKRIACIRHKSNSCIKHQQQQHKTSRTSVTTLT